MTASRSEQSPSVLSSSAVVVTPMFVAKAGLASVANTSAETARTIARDRLSARYLLVVLTISLPPLC